MFNYSLLYMESNNDSGTFVLFVAGYSCARTRKRKGASTRRGTLDGVSRLSACVSISFFFFLFRERQGPGGPKVARVKGNRTSWQIGCHQTTELRAALS